MQTLETALWPLRVANMKATEQPSGMPMKDIFVERGRLVFGLDKRVNGLNQEKDVSSYEM